MSIALLASIFAVGCGGDDNGGTVSAGSGTDSSSSSAASESNGDEQGADAGDLATVRRAQFTDRANKLCLAGERRLIFAVNDYVAKQSQKERAAANGGITSEAVQEVMLPELQKLIDKLDQLPPPTDEEEAIDEIVASTQGAIDFAEENPSYSFDELKDTFFDAGEPGRAYGLEGCLFG